MSEQRLDLVLDMTKNAMEQAAEMKKVISPEEYAEVDAKLEAMQHGSVQGFLKRAHRKADTPMGPLYYLRAGRVRIMVALDVPYQLATVVGFGLREA